MRAAAVVWRGLIASGSIRSASTAGVPARESAVERCGERRPFARPVSPYAPKTARVRGEVGVDEVGADDATREGALLVHADRPEHPVVDDDHDDRQVVLHSVASSWPAIRKSPSPEKQTRAARDAESSRRAPPVGRIPSRRSSARAAMRIAWKRQKRWIQTVWLPAPFATIACGSRVARCAMQSPTSSRPGHRVVALPRLVVRARRPRPRAPAWRRRAARDRARRSASGADEDRQRGLVDAAELFCARVHVHERLRAVAADSRGSV